MRSSDRSSFHVNFINRCRVNQIFFYLQFRRISEQQFNDEVVKASDVHIVVTVCGTAASEIAFNCVFRVKTGLRSNNSTTMAKR